MLMMERMRKRSELQSDLRSALKGYDERFVNATVAKLEAMERSNNGMRFEDLDDVTVSVKDARGNWKYAQMEHRNKVVVWSVLERHCPTRAGARSARLGLPY